MSDTDDKVILVKQKSILAELCKDPDCSEEVKRVLKAYNPAAKKYETNLKALGQFTEPVLEDAALFFGGKPRTEDGTSKRYRDKASLIDWLIMAIEGLFPQFCEACESDYVLTRSDKPKFNCSSCGGGSHNCTVIQQQPLCNVPGFVWVCSSCAKKHSLENFSGVNGELASPPKSAASDATEDSLRRKFSFMSTVEESEEKKTTGTKTGNDMEVIEEDLSGKRDETPIPVCQQYLQHRCKHGRSGTKMVNGVPCQKSHPPLCRKFCSNGSMKKYGCQLGKECRFFHPPLCRSSQFRHECFKKDCRFQHLRNTRRANVEDQLQRTQPTDAGRTRTRSSYSGVTAKSNNDVPRAQQLSGNSNSMCTQEQPPFDQNAFLERLLGEMGARMEERVMRMLDKRLEDYEPKRHSWRDR